MPDLICPVCGHPTRYHSYNHDRMEWQCWERMSEDHNNDFCGCQHGAPLEWELEKAKKRLAKEQTTVDELTKKIASR
jgi:hypothetical protein